MFSHVMIGTNDLEKAKSFYDALLGTLGVRPGRVDRHRVFYMTPTGVFSVSKPIDGKPATPANGGTIGFAASSPEQADAWHATGVANGGKLNRPSLAIELPNGNIMANDDLNHRVIVIDKATKAILWQYGVTGQRGLTPGYLAIPDGLDIIKADPNG